MSRPTISVGARAGNAASSTLHGHPSNRLAHRIKSEDREASTWRQEASRIGLTSNQIGRMASAFEHDDLKKAAGSQN